MSLTTLKIEIRTIQGRYTPPASGSVTEECLIASQNMKPIIKISYGNGDLDLDVAHQASHARLLVQVIMLQIHHKPGDTIYTKRLNGWD